MEPKTAIHRAAAKDNLVAPRPIVRLMCDNDNPPSRRMVMLRNAMFYAILLGICWSPFVITGAFIWAVFG